MDAAVPVHHRPAPVDVPVEPAAVDHRYVLLNAARDRSRTDAVRLTCTGWQVQAHRSHSRPIRHVRGHSSWAPRRQVPVMRGSITWLL